MFLQDKQAGSNSDLNDEEFVVVLVKLSEYKCISKEQHKQFLMDSNPITHKEKVIINTHLLGIHK